MPDHESFRKPCRVEDREGNRGWVSKNPWHTYAGWYVTVQWDEDSNFSATGFTDERIVNLSIVRD